MRGKEKLTVTANGTGVGEITDFVREHLAEHGIKGKDLTREILAIEETAGILAKHTPDEGTISVRIGTFMNRVRIDLSSKGDRFELTDKMEDSLLFEDETGEAAQDMIRKLLLKSLAENIKYRHIRGINRITISGDIREKGLLYDTLGSMLLAIIIGAILSMLGFSKFNSILDSYILVPVKTMYMNALKMVAAPVVFFSIVTCIVRFSDISELGRVGGRILALYMLTTFIAVMIGTGVFFLFRPGSAIPEAAMLESAKELASKTMNVSIKDLIVGIVPDDFLDPFLKSNMLQLIFLAIVCGIATGMIGRYSEPVKNCFEALNDLFLNIMTLVIRFMPAAIFSSFCSLMLNVGTKTLMTLLGIFATFLFGLFCMLMAYCILMLVFARLNPIPFLKKYSSTMVRVFSVASSNASIPLNMGACESLGIAKKIYSLSVPLGATVNMDGSCVYLAVFSFALAKTYGVEITGASVTAMILTIIILSVGAPGIPGSGLICLSVLLTQLGVPAEAIGLVMGIDSIVGMFRCMSNCTGDVAVSTIVAKKENLLDMEKYGSKVRS